MQKQAKRGEGGGERKSAVFFLQITTVLTDERADEASYTLFSPRQY